MCCATSSMSCSNANAAPAAARSTRSGLRDRPVISGGSVATGSAVNLPPRSRHATSRGMITVSESSGRSSWRLRRRSIGELADVVVTVRSAWRTAPVGDQSSRWSMARASGPHASCAASICSSDIGRADGGARPPG